MIQVCGSGQTDSEDTIQVIKKLQPEAMSAPAKKSKDGNEKPSTLELYGKATLVTILVLFAIEMAVLVPLLRFGMDISPMTTWIDSTFGSSLTAVCGAYLLLILCNSFYYVQEKGQPTSWGMAFAVAYGITRATKPIQLMLAGVLTPIVARFLSTGPAEAKAKAS